MSMTTHDVRTLLLRTMGPRSVREMATEIKVSPSYLYDVLRGARPPGPTILTYLQLDRNIETIVTYRPRKRRAR